MIPVTWADASLSQARLLSSWVVSELQDTSPAFSSLNNMVYWSCQGECFDVHTSPVPYLSPPCQCSFTPKCSPYPCIETLSRPPAACSSPDLLNPHCLHAPKPIYCANCPCWLHLKASWFIFLFHYFMASLHSCFLLCKVQDRWMQRPSCYCGPWASLHSQKCWLHLLVMSASWPSHD